MSIIYAIPGIGTTKELFQNIAVAGHELKILEWPAAEKQFTMTDYAKAFIPQIDTQQPVNLMGVSFGGMLCAELSHHISTKKVVLISSCRNRREFPFLLRFLRVVPVHKLISERLFRRLVERTYYVFGFDKNLAHAFAAMAWQMPPHYFSRCIDYIIQWKRTDDHPSIVSIHGDADRLLTPTNIRKGYSIKGGSHVMVLEKANDINPILSKEFYGC